MAGRRSGADRPPLASRPIHCPLRRYAPAALARSPDPAPGRESEIANAAGVRPDLEVSWEDSHHRAARVLVSAFAADPSWSSELRTPRARQVVLARLLSVLTVEAAAHRGLLIARDDREVVGAACVWMPGFHPTPRPTGLYLVAGVAIVRHAGIRTLRVLQRWRAVQRADPAAEHWHLAMLGVQPSWQGRGVGTSLVTAYLRRVDEAHGAAYLETGRLELVAWYARFGFGVRDELVLPGGRTAWTMWREPAASGSNPVEASD